MEEEDMTQTEAQTSDWGGFKLGDHVVLCNPTNDTGEPMPEWEGLECEVVEPPPPSIILALMGEESASPKLRAINGRPDGVPTPFYWSGPGWRDQVVRVG